MVRAAPAFVVPSSWRRFVLPRHGDPGVAPWSPDPQALDEIAQARTAGAGLLRDVLHRDGTDPAIREAGLAHLAGTADPLGAAAVAAVVLHGVDRSTRVRPRAVADRWLTDHGPAFAASAAVELTTLTHADLGADHWRFTRRQPGAVRVNPPAVDDTVTVLTLVRTALAALPDADYATCVTALRVCRQGTVGQRISASFVAPTETAWHADDCAAVAAAADRFGAAMMLMAVRSQGDVEMLLPFIDEYEARYPHVPYTVAAGAGPGAVPVLVQWLDTTNLFAADRRRLLAILATLPSDAAFQALVDRIQGRYVAPALAAAARRWPARAMRILAASAAPDRPEVAEALRLHTLTHPDLALPTAAAGSGAASDSGSVGGPEAGSVGTTDVGTVAGSGGGSVAAPGAGRVAVASAGTPAGLPAVLVTPPWTVGRAGRRVVVAGPRSIEAPAMVWAPGERDEWLSWNRYRDTVHARENWPVEAERFGAGRLTAWEQPRFFTMAPEALARPLVGAWRPGRMRGDETWLHVVVARFELDALPMALDAARLVPAAAAAALLPYAAHELALAMADWSLRRPSLSTVAVAWLTRHAGLAARALVPLALSRSAPDRRRAERGLRLLDGAGHRTEVTRAAQAYGTPAATAIRAVLDVDPLLILPARIPAPPAWADPAVLPPIRLRDAAATLPATAVRHLLTMLAMSRPDGPYAGLAIVRAACEPADLAEFAEGLGTRWTASGSPSKDAWVTDAGTLLDDDGTS